MRYISTRGRAPAIDFGDVLLTGLAPDGGLYLPETWPSTAPPALAGRTYAEYAVDVMWPFVEGAIDRESFEQLTAEAYRTFSVDEVVPLTTLPDGLVLVELFWGPTLAFKDIAMQLLGRLFDHELGRRSERVTIVGATSGDTGSAAIEAFRDRANVEIVILHPAGRTSEVQRRQMTTVDATNVHNVAIEGTFDDCQDLVKAMFGDAEFRRGVRLAAVNSINWARVMAQIVYYHWAVARLDRPDPLVEVVVPTGNFGNVFAGRVAQRTGAAIDRFLVASNRNDILTRLFETGEMRVDTVEPTLSPSMDIQISSNLERLLYELLDGDGIAVADLMATFRENGHVTLTDDMRGRLGEHWRGERVDDPATIEVMRQVHDESGLVIDPHTAVGVAAARRTTSGHEQLVMATAHPAKFPDAVERATGFRPPLPPHLADLLERPEHYRTLPNDLDTVREAVAAVAR